MAASQQHYPMTRHAVFVLWLVLATCLLCGCARSTDPPRTQPAAAHVAVEDEREPLSAADEAAQAAERHADAVERAANGGKDPGPIIPTPPKPPSAGPELTLEQLRARMLRLALGPAQDVDDEVAHVAKVMGVPLQPWRENWLTASGRLREGGGYSIDVESTNDAEASREVLIHFYTDIWQGDSTDNSNEHIDCNPPLDSIGKQLVAANYKEWKSKPPGRQLRGFNRPDSSDAAASSMTLSAYRAQPGPGKIHDCIYYVRIGIFKSKDKNDENR